MRSNTAHNVEARKESAREQAFGEGQILYVAQERSLQRRKAQNRRRHLQFCRCRRRFWIVQGSFMQLTGTKISSSETANSLNRYGADLVHTHKLHSPDRERLLGVLIALESSINGAIVHSSHEAKGTSLPDLQEAA